MLKGEKMYKTEIQILKMLANGINYFTGERCESDSILNDVNISRTLFNVCEILQSSKKKTSKKNGDDFVFYDSILTDFPYENRYISLTELLRKIGILHPLGQKPRFNFVADLLMSAGMLENVVDNSGSQKKMATAAAADFGIRNLEKVSINGYPYSLVGYNEQGQRYVLEALKEACQCKGFPL